MHIQWIYTHTHPTTLYSAESRSMLSGGCYTFFSRDTPIWLRAKVSGGGGRAYAWNSRANNILRDNPTTPYQLTTGRPNKKDLDLTTPNFFLRCPLFTFQYIYIYTQTHARERTSPSPPPPDPGRFLPSSLSLSPLTLPYSHYPSSLLYSRRRKASFSSFTTSNALEMVGWLVCTELCTTTTTSSSSCMKQSRTHSCSLLGVAPPSVAKF